MKDMKFIVIALLLALIGWSGVGCTSTNQLDLNPNALVGQIGSVAASIDPADAVAIASAIAGNPNVVALAEAVMSNDALMEQLNGIAANFAEVVNQDEADPDPVIDPNVDPPAPSAALPPLQVGRTLAGYGRANRWANGGATLEESLAILQADLDACTLWGVRIYDIEFSSWGRYAANKTEFRAWTEAAYALLLRHCRANGMWVFNSVFNDNQGSRGGPRKYGDAGVDLQHSPEMVSWAIGVVKAGGPANVLLQPVAESGRTSYGTQLEKQMASEFDALGFKLIYNHGSRPSSCPAPFDWAAVHPFKITDTFPVNRLNVSDTGMIIQQLCSGLEGPGKPDVAYAWIKEGADRGEVARIFYHFKWAGPSDVATIQAIGSAVPPISTRNTSTNLAVAPAAAMPSGRPASASFSEE